MQINLQSLIRRSLINCHLDGRTLDGSSGKSEIPACVKFHDIWAGVHFVPREVSRNDMAFPGGQKLSVQLS
jgi:hypothetical protein